MIARTFLLTTSSVSPKLARRSEWPTSTSCAPASATCGTETSPVHAPASAQCAFCAPSSTSESGPSSLLTSASTVAGGMMKACTPPHALWSACLSAST